MFAADNPFKDLAIKGIKNHSDPSFRGKNLSVLSMRAEISKKFMVCFCWDWTVIPVNYYLDGGHRSENGSMMIRIVKTNLIFRFGEESGRSS